AELVGPALHRAGAAEDAAARAAHAERSAAALERSVADYRTLLAQVAISQEQQRQRLAVDIHDDSVQVMTAAGMRLQTIQEGVRDEELAERLEEVQSTIRLAARRLRHLM